MIVDDVIVILVVLIASIISLLLFRYFKILKKDGCPNCKNPVLHRKHRTFNDKMLIIMTLYILPFKRYKCRKCGWEGLRWQIERKAPRP